jgi:periplasmic protein TonB
MTRNEVQTPRADNPDEQYEATVLDFLEQEIAATQPGKDKKDQSAELDALVSDLLKQVISESDQQPESQQSAPEDLNAVLSEFVPQEEARSGENVRATVTDSIGAQARAESAGGPQPKIAAPILFAPAAAAPKRRMPLIAAALVCLLGLIGGFVYFSRPHNGQAEKNPDKSIVQPSSSTSSAAPAKSQAVEPAQAAAPIASPSVMPAAARPVAPVVADTPARTAASDTPKASQQNNQAAAKSLKEKPETAASAPPLVKEIAPNRPETPAPAADKGPEPKSFSSPLLEHDVTATLVPAQPAAAASTNIEIIKPTNIEITVRQGVIPAVPIAQVSPTYPEMALRTRTSATVVLDLQIDAQGKVVKATPVSGPALFHESAVSAAMKWRYRPATLNGSSVSSQSRVTMRFNLQK